MQEQYNGILEDTRTEEEKAKDFNAKELLVSSSNLFREVNNLSEVKAGKVRNQNGSGSCVANAICKALEMAFKKINIDVQFSSVYHYQNRPNRPQAGMHPPTASEWVRVNGILLESAVPSMNMSDEVMDSILISGRDKDKALEYFQNRLVEYYVDNTPSFEETAQYINQNGNAMILVRTTYQAWCKDKPDAVRGEVVNHEICGVDAVNYKGEDVIFIDDSWGKWGSSEMGERGQRILNKQTLEAIATQVITWKIQNIDVKNLQLKACKYGDKNADVRNLQNYLKSTGDFSQTQASTGYYGDMTAKAVLSWQIKNKVDDLVSLNALGGHNFGPKSLAKYNQLKSMPKILQSSQNPQQLSLTIKGLLLAVLPIANTILAKYNIQIATGDIDTLINGGLTIVSGVTIIYGLYRKFRV